MKYWFTSDNHFGHKNILKFNPDTRRGADADEMNRLMIAKWQEQVQPEDIVFTLGDVFFCNANDALSIVDRLPGQKHLIWGNHDQVIEKNSILRSRFVSVQNYKELTLDGTKVVLFHYPIYEWNKMHHGSYHLYGHVHGHVQIEGRALDVGIDGGLATGDMRLFSWEEINNHLSKKPVRTHHDKVGT